MYFLKHQNFCLFLVVCLALNVINSSTSPAMVRSAFLQQRLLGGSGIKSFLKGIVSSLFILGAACRYRFSSKRFTF